MKNIEELTRKIVRVESILIFLSISAIAYGDFLAGEAISLGYLYLIPLTYSALTHRVWTTVVLVGVCVTLRQWLGPLELSPWFYFLRDWALTGVFLSVVTVLHRLGNDRRRFFETAREQRDQLAREVELAAEVQEHLLSKHIPPKGKFDIEAKTWPARVVGGDYYDFIELEGGRLAVVIADVSGKGLPAAMLMPAAQIALRTLASSGKKICEILQELNHVLLEATDRARYATLFYGALNLQTGHLRYVNAGHLPGLLFRASGGEVEWLSAGGPPVGLMEDVTFQAGEVHLSPGDLLLLYTDGVVEAENCDSEAYGEERLVDLVRGIRLESCQRIIDSVHQSVAEFLCEADQADDLTLITVRKPA